MQQGSRGVFARSGAGGRTLGDAARVARTADWEGVAVLKAGLRDWLSGPARAVSLRSGGMGLSLTCELRIDRISDPVMVFERSPANIKKTLIKFLLVTLAPPA